MPHYEARIEITRRERFMRKNFREVILVAGNTQQYRLLQRGEQPRPRDFTILAPGNELGLHRIVERADDLPLAQISVDAHPAAARLAPRSEEHTSELQSLMRTSSPV